MAGCVSEILILYEIFELLTSGDPNRQQQVIDCLSDSSKTREMTYGTWLAICNIQDNYFDRSLLTQSEATLRHFDLLYPDELVYAIHISSSNNFLSSVFNSRKLCGGLSRDDFMHLSTCMRAFHFLRSPYLINQIENSDIIDLVMRATNEMLSPESNLLDENPALTTRISEEMWFILAKKSTPFAKWPGLYKVLSAEHLAVLIVDHYEHFLLDDVNVLKKIAPLVGSGRYDPPPWFRRLALRKVFRQVFSLRIL